MTFTPVRQDPPARRNAVINDEILELLRGDPDRWYLIAVRPNHASYYYKAKRPADIDLLVKYRRDPGTGRRFTEVYAKSCSRLLR